MLSSNFIIFLNFFREIIPLVISRSVTITLITTKELVLKDFALEPDEKKLQRGADLVVQNLAGNLALVTSREPLKLSFQGILKNLLDQTDLDESSKDTIVQNVCVDNLDLGCALIKKAVIEKARDDVTQDQALLEAAEKRRNSKLTGIPFYDDTIFHALQQIPEPLRPSIGGLNKDQMRIYEDFGKTAKVNIMKGPTRMSTKGGKELDPESVEIIARFELYLAQLDKELEVYLELQAPEKLKELQQNHKKIMEFITTSGANEEVYYECAIRILDSLFNDQISGKKINFFLAVLQEFRKYDENLPTDILDWIITPTEKRIAKSEYFMKLIKDNFINTQELDAKFADLLEHQGGNSMIYSSIFKIVKTFVIDEKLFEPGFFAKTLPILLKILSQLKDSNPKVVKLFEDFRNAIMGNANLNNQTRPKISPLADSFYKNTLQQAFTYFREREGSNDSDLYDFANLKLQELLKIENEDEMIEFIVGLESAVFSNNETFIRFLAYMVDICVEDALKSLEKFENYGRFNFLPAFDFSSIDCLSRFFILILKSITNIPRNEIFEKILQGIVLILTKNHDLHREKFNQRPFFRLFYTMIYDIKRPEFSFNPQEINNYLQILMKVFDRLQPLKYPGFAYAWFELISGRNFMPLVLLAGVISF